MQRLSVSYYPKYSNTLSEKDHDSMFVSFTKQTVKRIKKMKDGYFPTSLTMLEPQKSVFLMKQKKTILQQ